MSEESDYLGSDEIGRSTGPTASELQLELVTQASGIGVWNVDLVTGAMTWSNSMYELLGVPESSEVTLRSLIGYVHPEDKPAVMAAVRGRGRDLPRDGESGSLEYRVVRPDGRVIWLSGRGRVAFDPETDHPLAQGVVVDVTAQKEAEEREREARRTAESVRERMEFLAEAGRILASSLEYQETLRQVAKLAVPRLADWCAVDLLEQEKLVRVAVEHQDPEKVRWAHDLLEMFPPDPRSRTGAYEVLRSGKPDVHTHITDDLLEAVTQDADQLEVLRAVGFSSSMLLPLVCRGQSLGVLTLVQAESGRHYGEEEVRLAMQLAERAALAVDNSRLYREARRSNERLELRVAERTAELALLNNELESFTYSASHDLRGPLRGIDGFAQALLEDYGDDLADRAMEYLHRVRAAAARMGTIIDALLSLSRLNRYDLNRVPLDLSKKVGDSIARLLEAEPAREVEFEIESDVKATGDPALVRLLLDNLLENAWKFTRSRSPARVWFGTVERNGESIYFVRDNGIGFEMAYVHRLFEPFQRIHLADEDQGTGVGLATALRIVKRHGGRIWAEGVPDGGATFFFTLK